MPGAMMHKITTTLLVLLPKSILLPIKKTQPLYTSPESVGTKIRSRHLRVRMRDSACEWQKETGRERHRERHRHKLCVLPNISNLCDVQSPECVEIPSDLYLDPSPAQHHVVTSHDRYLLSKQSKYTAITQTS